MRLTDSVGHGGGRGVRDVAFEGGPDSFDWDQEQPVDAFAEAVAAFAGSSAAGSVG
ncbi:hypothetical protein Asi03nite_44450 [Actinoplanes siamensis]|uniref:Uncharacterized protein n=1 Tax=Actinoplanes siamensis TaxID=1223317 RepID=A0A919TLR9_9ACTN|nr:hypothetical protein Asi03nite_44450 [Actinoplanes siamensis]